MQEAFYDTDGVIDYTFPPRNRGHKRQCTIKIWFGRCKFQRFVQICDPQGYGRLSARSSSSSVCAISLAGDPYGVFNLFVMCHDDCLQFIRCFNVPLMVLGSGGYNIPNVVGCWCSFISFVNLFLISYHTSLVSYNVFFFLFLSVGVELDDNLSPYECMDDYEQDNRLHIKPDSMTNFNTDRDMEEIR